MEGNQPPFRLCIKDRASLLVHLAANDAAPMHYSDNRLIATGVLTTLLLVTSVQPVQAFSEFSKSPFSVFQTFAGLETPKEKTVELPSVLKTVEYLDALNTQENASDAQSNKEDVLPGMSLEKFVSDDDQKTLPILPQDNIGLSTFFSGFHPGLDIRAKVGTPIHAIKAGKILDTGFEKGGYGRYVLIGHNDTDGSPMVTLYAHMKDVTVANGNDIDGNSIIGHVGMTGHTTGAHLHFEIHKGSKAIDPIKYFAGSKAITKTLAKAK